MAKETSLKPRIAEFILILLAAIAALVVVRYLADQAVVPEDVVLPIDAVVVLLGGYAVIWLVDRTIARIAGPTVGATRARGLRNLFDIVAAILLSITVFAIFGVNVAAALIGAGFLAIVLGLAAQQVLGNIFAGISLLASKQFEIGDRVTLATSSYSLTGSTYSQESQASGFTGVVRDVGIFFTRLELDNGLPAIFPNSVVIGALIINHSKMTERTVRVRLNVDNKIDFEEFRDKLLGSLKQHDVIDSDKTHLEVVDLGASTYQAVVVAWTKSEFEEPIKTLVIRDAMAVQAELSR